MKTRYIGIYTYTKNGFPFTKMIDFDRDIDVVTASIKNHMATKNNDPNAYHITEYSCYDWANTDPNDLPVKVASYSISNIPTT